MKRVADRDHVGVARELARAFEVGLEPRTGLGRGPLIAQLSAVRAVEDLQHLGHRDAAREQQHREVVDDVGALLGDPLLGLARWRP